MSQLQRRSDPCVNRILQTSAVCRGNALDRILSTQKHARRQHTSIDRILSTKTRPTTTHQQIELCPPTHARRQHTSRSNSVHTKTRPKTTHQHRSNSVHKNKPEDNTPADRTMSTNTPQDNTPALVGPTQNSAPTRELAAAARGSQSRPARVEEWMRMHNSECVPKPCWVNDMPPRPRRIGPIYMPSVAPQRKCRRPSQLQVRENKGDASCRFGLWCVRTTASDERAWAWSAHRYTGAHLFV